MQKKRGSAILIAILLVTGIGAVAFSFGRILYLQVASASRYENGTGAYYAAESGIEEGFLRYRYDRSAQLPTYYGDSNNWLVNQNTVDRNDLFGAKLVGDSISGVAKATTVSDLSKQYYDLRMGSGSTAVQSQISSSDPSDINSNAAVSTTFTTDVNSPYYIARDTMKKIDLGNIFSDPSNDITLFFKSYSQVTTPTVLSDSRCTLIEAKIVGKKQDGTIEERKTMITGYPGTCNYAGGGIKLEPGSFITYNATADFSLAGSLKGQIASIVPYDQASLYLKPIGADISYKIRENLAATPIALASNTIISTGYYGGTTRTLQTKIDYQNGSLFDLYDYVIFSGN